MKSIIVKNGYRGEILVSTPCKECSGLELAQNKATKLFFNMRSETYEGRLG